MEIEEGAEDTAVAVVGDDEDEGLGEVGGPVVGGDREDLTRRGQGGLQGRLVKDILKRPCYRSKGF